jgi:hypothetical protein
MHGQSCTLSLSAEMKQQNFSNLQWCNILTVNRLVTLQLLPGMARVSSGAV